jgi:hypothetical protein
MKRDLLILGGTDWFRTGAKSPVLFVLALMLLSCAGHKAAAQDFLSFSDSAIHHAATASSVVKLANGLTVQLDGVSESQTAASSVWSATTGNVKSSRRSVDSGEINAMQPGQKERTFDFLLNAVPRIKKPVLFDIPQLPLFFPKSVVPSADSAVTVVPSGGHHAHYFASAAFLTGLQYSPLAVAVPQVAESTSVLFSNKAGITHVAQPGSSLTIVNQSGALSVTVTEVMPANLQSAPIIPLYECQTMFYDSKGRFVGQVESRGRWSNVLNVWKTSVPVPPVNTSTVQFVAMPCELVQFDHVCLDPSAAPTPLPRKRRHRGRHRGHRAVLSFSRSIR